MSYYHLLWGWICLALVIFPLNLFITAPYGRHSKASWGPMISNRWGWVLMELPALLTFPLIFLYSPQAGRPVAALLLALWMLHYFNRSLVFPLRQKTRGKQMPLLIALFAIVFNLGNGYFNGWYQGFMAQYPAQWWYDPRFVLGGLLFGAGMGINWHSDNLLLRLRKPGETGYKIPAGGMFRYVSCPNHLGEIIEWTGFALMSWSWAGFAFALWTAANLIPRALAHHRWYRQHFPHYPAGRRAVIPWLL
ncbi:MAG: 3-oxo-5-alpha-steroid 4-dehydrogenase [Bacteroidetes bacterium]|nr:MAG: 3-oxo-5-alpha-steroid 4-dehydrogenase [Bacteroidota bacterium]